MAGSQELARDPAWESEFKISPVDWAWNKYASLGPRRSFNLIRADRAS